MKFLLVTIHVRDLDESIAFYRDIVGLAVKRRFSGGPGVEIAFLGEGETEVELISDAKNPDVSVGTGISIGFETASVNELISSLREKCVPVISEVIQPNPHVKFFFATDPNGVRIEFLESIG
ncbi:MAG: VOC family protein [Synergistaceae bacterium]|jgi:lactoylglutathione lyase|nr:VOC family protein [Synergistaceae bacterium]